MGRKKREPSESSLIREKSSSLPALPPDDERLQDLARAMADPQDIRSDEELSEELSIPVAQIRRLRSTPSFFEPVLAAFKRNLQGIAPEIIKGLYRQFKGGSGPASKLLLETIGMVSGGSSVNVNVGSGGSGVDDQISKMSDDDLDREAHRLLREVFPGDVIYSEGKVIPAEVMVVEEVEDE